MPSLSLTEFDRVFKFNTLLLHLFVYYMYCLMYRYTKLSSAFHYFFQIKTLFFKFIIWSTHCFQHTENVFQNRFFIIRQFRNRLSNALSSFSLNVQYAKSVILIFFQKMLVTRVLWFILYCIHCNFDFDSWLF